jgi:hypothetical protein
MTNDELLEERIREWRESFRRRQAVRDADVEELEDHLRSQVEALSQAGLDADEAFLVAVKRLGNLDSVSHEFANEYTERLWKQLVIGQGSSVSSAPARREATLAVGLAVAAAVAVKLPELFGKRIDGPDPDESFYAHNLGLLILPFLAAFFAFKRGLHRSAWGWLIAPFLAAAVIINVMPFVSGGQTEILSAIHLPIGLWLAVGFAYAAALWRSHEQRMNFVRFSGEWFIYFVLIALGGGVLSGITVFIFNAIGFDVEDIIGRWIVLCGAAGGFVIAAWLVEHKQSVVENMAPVLTMLFTPLFTVLLLIFVVTMALSGNAIDVNREVLIGFDVLLVLVLGLLLYSISARDSLAPPGRFDWLRLLLVICALIVDALALWAIAERISEFGFSPNKTAALGLNILLLVNLGVSAVLYAQFLTRRSPFTRLERWQTAYLPFFGVWAWFVFALFPVIFNYK